ncbi:MAG: PspC domain-containing protein [Chitinophagaceae bacterium]|nr:PspC domain-containing protein [Chitinophagaceae bacterium]
MKKVININFQGRVIPIEETAYEALKQYIESLRRYFAHEEGRDEIINDIENRIAELFDEKLKKGAVCITDEDVNAVMVSMGRPEDFEEQDATYAGSATDYAKTESSQSTNTQQAYEEPRRLSRAANDKVLGGVCAGIAHYMKIDPAVVRIIFALIAFGGFGFGIVLYIILWIILPVRPLQANVRKRLYRDPENKLIGGVAGGLSAYFNIDTWIPRLIFLLPFLFGMLPNIFSGFWWHWRGPWVAFSGLGGTFFVTYIILWIVLPKAVTASEKLEMRGEKIDLESIKNTVQEELQSVKNRGEKLGTEFREKAKIVGAEMKETIGQRTQAFAAEVGPAARKTGTGIGNAIGILFKAFFLCIAGCIAFALLIALIAILYSGVAVFPLKNFLLEGFWQNFFAWSVLTLFIGVPIIALVVWIVRRIMRVKSRNPYLGYTFGSLWILGLISLFVLIGMVGRNFRIKTSVNEDVAITQPANGNMFIKVMDGKVRYYSSDWFDGDFPFLSLNEDSMLLNTVRLKVVKSEDSAYHIRLIKLSLGNTPASAENNAGSINFPITQKDSAFYFPKGFPVSSTNKFRNQQVMVIVEVPVGKKIMIDGSIDRYDWFDINFNRRKGWNIDWKDKWDNSYSWDNNVQYIMTNDGLERTDKKYESKDDNKKVKNGKFKLKADDNGVEIEAEGELEDGKGTYRYKKNGDNEKIEIDTVKPAAPASPNPPKQSKPAERKITTSENESEREELAGKKTSEDLHTPFLFLTTGR